MQPVSKEYSVYLEKYAFIKEEFSQGSFIIKALAIFEEIAKINESIKAKKSYQGRTVGTEQNSC